MATETQRYFTVYLSQRQDRQNMSDIISFNFFGEFDNFEVWKSSWRRTVYAFVSTLISDNGHLIGHYPLYISIPLSTRTTIMPIL